MSRQRSRFWVLGLSRAAVQGRVGRLRKAAVRRARGGAGLSVALYPPRRHRQQPPDRLRPAACHLQVEGLPHQGARSIQKHEARHRRAHRRFLIHVLPKGLHRVRHYGLSLAACAGNIAAPASCSPPQNLRVNPPAPWSIPAILLPCCGGCMIIIEVFERGRTPRH
jgi:Putative transposase